MIYLNGRLVSGAEAGLDPADRGLLLGDGLFETLLCVTGRPLGLKAHFERLASGAATLGIALAPTLDDLADGIARLLDARDLTREPAALRITLTRGAGPRGLLPPEPCRPNLMMTAEQISSAEPPPAAVAIASVRRNEHSPAANLKTLNYLDNLLARREAARRGADEAIMLNTAGRLCCGSTSNLFLVVEGGLATPSLGEGVLPGITRSEVIAVASGLGMTVAERPLGPDDLGSAEAAFLTNSLIGLRRIASVDGRALNHSRSAIAVLKEEVGRRRNAA